MLARLLAVSLALTASLAVAPAIAQSPSSAAPKDAPKADASKANAPKADAPKADASKANAPKADAPKADAPKAEASGPRRDPAGQTGISPYMEIIVKGQAAYVARDFPGAITAFQDAIKLDPNLMLAFYQLGEMMLETGKVEDAEATWKTALTKKGTEDLNGKVLFCLADLRERQKNWQAAKEAWTAYAAFLNEHPKANGYPGTATERMKVIDRRVKDEQDYGAVKDRTKKREEERLKEAEENAKKDKLNK